MLYDYDDIHAGEVYGDDDDDDIKPDDDDVHAGDVYGEPPPVHVAAHVHACEQHTPGGKLTSILQRKGERRKQYHRICWCFNVL